MTCLVGPTPAPQCHRPLLPLSSPFGAEARVAAASLAPGRPSLCRGVSPGATAPTRPLMQTKFRGENLTDVYLHCSGTVCKPGLHTRSRLCFSSQTSAEAVNPAWHSMDALADRRASALWACRPCSVLGPVPRTHAAHCAFPKRSDRQRHGTSDRPGPSHFVGV